MSAAAVLKKLLELQKNSALPIFQDDPPLYQELKSQTEELSFFSEKILNVLIFSIVYIFIHILCGFLNWLSRYMYFKAKRPSSTLVHSLYYTLVYPSGIGKIFHKYVLILLTFTAQYIQNTIIYGCTIFHKYVILEAVEMSVLYQSKSLSDSSCEAPTILSSTPRYNIK